MGHKSGAVFAGAKGVATLDTDAAIALATDAQLENQLEDAGVSRAKKKAQKAAPSMVKQLIGIAKDGKAPEGARVSAAREVLHQAEGRPATQREGAAQGNLTVVLANFTIGTSEPAVTLPVVELDDETLEAEFDSSPLVIDLDDLELDEEF